MSIKSELTKTTSYLREARNAIKARGGQISDTAGLKDLPEAINSIPSGSSNDSPLPKIVDGSITEVTGEDLNGATKIRERAFYKCSQLVSVEIPDGVASIEQYAFGNCTRLSSVVMPNNVIEVGSNAFNGTDITSLYIQDIEMWCKSTFGNIVIQNGANFFLNGELLKHVTIPSAVQSVTGRCFYNCISIETVIVPEGVTHIESTAFYGCINLKKVTMPSTMAIISASAFYGCSNLTEVDLSSATVVPELQNSNAFSKINETCQIKVPTALYDEWIAATNWVKVAQYIVAV